MDFPIDQCIHQLFEAQVERTPDAVALVFANEQLTYRELNQKSNQLAHYLRSLGVGLEVLVGICTERSLETVIGLLGILKAGGAYVPLDPDYPKDRLAFMLGDSNVPVILTQERLVAGLPKHEAKAICIDSMWSVIARNRKDNPVSLTKPENLAYAIYTSGSTGRPKGVLGLHRGAVNRFFWMWKTYPFESGEVCCQKTSLNFVDSVWEIFGPLLQGIRVTIIPTHTVMEPKRLVQTLASDSVTRIVLVPSLLATILNTNEDLGQQLPKLKMWISSGEALMADLARRFQQKMPRNYLLNIYGSSEVSADVTWYEVNLLKEDILSVPIGRPISNTRIYILDHHMQPVPIGVTGELYVGGAGIARGYLNNPTLTAEKFILNPFSKEPGDRLYKTGDLARYLPDGNIDFLGRIDHQVKVRGFRIEIGEIEMVLSRHPQIGEAVVTVREESSESKYLAAYMLSKQGLTPSLSDIRDFLKTTLPEYMIPSRFVFLDKMPLTPNGKVDRKALPEPELGCPEINIKFVEPKTEIERKIATIWEKVLNLDKVSIHDNFFDLGGHSLMAIQVVIAAEEVGLPLTIGQIFQYQTISTLAGFLSKEGSNKKQA